MHKQPPIVCLHRLQHFLLLLIVGNFLPLSTTMTTTPVTTVSHQSTARIVKLVARHLKMHLPKPYKMSSGIMYHADTVLVEVHVQQTNDDNTPKLVIGYGEGAPYHSPTAHELPASMLQYLKSRVGPQLLHQDPVHLLMEQQFTTNPDVNHIVAMGALDMALWDVRGKLEGKPVCDLLGRVRDTADVLWPVSSDHSLQDDVDAFDEKMALGFHTFMVKCGSQDVTTDIQRVSGLLQHDFGGTSVELIPDANQGWTQEQATQFIRALPTNTPNRIVFLEQPLDRDAPVENMMQLQKLAPPDLVFSADESIRSIEDIESICRHQHFQVASIKVCKVGGITGAMQACSTLAKANIQLYFNSMIEGSCAQAALLHVYCSTPQGVLDHLGHAFMSVLRLEEYADFYKCIHGAKVTVPLDRPGLGLEINRTKVEEITCDKIEVEI